MNKEFIWHLKVGEEKKIWKCVLLDNEVVTYEDGVVCNHLPITNPEVKQNVLQIDTVTTVYGQEVPFQLEKNVPYIKMDGKWSISKTTFEDRKAKLLKDQKIIFVSLIVLGLAVCLACVIRWLVKGTMGDWWFGLVMGSILIMTAFIQRYETNSQLKLIEEKK